MGWFSRDFIECYFGMKKLEIELVKDLSPEELCARYRAVY